MNYTGMCGPLNFADDPGAWRGIISPVGVQWKVGVGKFPFEMKVVDNSLDPAVRIEAPLTATNL